jgi:DNA-binding CsgD family transcriptional regulator
MQARPFAELSQRELQVLELIAADLGNQAISRRLGVSPKTVANTVSTILVKISVSDRAHAAAAARAAGLGVHQQSSRLVSGPIPGGQGRSTLSLGNEAGSDFV